MISGLGNYRSARGSLPLVLEKSGLWHSLSHRSLRNGTMTWKRSALGKDQKGWQHKLLSLLTLISLICRLACSNWLWSQMQRRCLGHLMIRTSWMWRPAAFKAKWVHTAGRDCHYHCPRQYGRWEDFFIFKIHRKQTAKLLGGQSQYYCKSLFSGLI